MYIHLYVLGRHHIEPVCENLSSSVEINCEANHIIRIDDVMWGRSDNATCGSGGQLIY